MDRNGTLVRGCLSLRLSRHGEGRLNLSPLEMLGLMLVGHAIADYPLQGDFLAKAKNRLAPLPGVPWYQALGAHAIIHGGFVGIITGNLPLGIAEAVAHAIADDSKCSGKIGFNGDQLIHIATKVVWCAIYFLVIHR